MTSHGLLHFGIVPNEPQHRGGTCTVVNEESACQFTLAIMEFDDQGLCFDRSGFKKIEDALDKVKDKLPIILVFVHGWQHNANKDDGNLINFQAVLAETAKRQNESRAAGRPVFGVFVGWRGRSTEGNDAWEYLSFWDRHQAAERVAQGSARELLGRLKAFRNGFSSDKSKPTLIIIGHSFGGLIVYTAIAQSLIEAAATSDKVVPSFGDLVLLVNPAFSAVSYLPIFSILWSGKTFDKTQLPVFVSVTAENDLATRDAFPAANLRLHIEEAVRGEHEGQALTRTMGHLDWLQTHQLALSEPPVAASTTSFAPSLELRKRVVKLSSAGARETFGSVVATRLGFDERTEFGSPDSPFWVAQATPKVIDGHSGIWLPPFQSFVHALVAAHLQQMESTPASPVAQAQSPPLDG